MLMSQHKSHEQGLSDLLNYAHFVEEGIIINKDGAFLVSYQFQAPDIHSATESELCGMTELVNRAMLNLSDGWMIHVDELRIPSIEYPNKNENYFSEKNSYFNNVAERIDDERRLYYKAEGAHYENRQYLTFVWKFPLPLIKTAKHWFVEGLSKDQGSQNLETLLSEFNEMVEKSIRLLSSYLKLVKLNSEALLSFLNTCITGELLDINYYGNKKIENNTNNQKNLLILFIDIILGRRSLTGGYVPKIGNKAIYVLSVLGYVNSHTMAGLLDEVSTYPMLYRSSHRFIPLSELTAQAEIKRYQKHWHNNVKGLMGMVKDALFSRNSTSNSNSTGSSRINHDALDMVDETDVALTANSNHSTRWGYWTNTIVFMHEDEDQIKQAVKSVKTVLEQKGFAAEIESVNTLEAWLGSIPGHGSCNIRRIFLNSLNLAHVLPLHTLWTGHSLSSKASLLPQGSPPVFYAKTIGSTPFRFHLDVGDVGHQLVLGPTGSGKSTWLEFLMAQFLRYEKAQIFLFDKDYSHKALTYALGGQHYDIGHSSDLAFCPLSQLETDSQKLRAGQFIEQLILLQNVLITPEIRHAISNAINLLSENNQCNHEKDEKDEKYEENEKYKKNRNLTVFRSLVQHSEVREALQFYTVEGSFKLLDAISDSLKKPIQANNSGFLHTFEMGWLLSQKPEIYLPVLMHIFNHITDYLEKNQGKYPTLIPIEESWRYLKHPVFAEQILDWQKTLRKYNARLVFIMTSLSDLYDPSTQSLNQLTASIVESCPTKIYLPNSQMDSEIEALYQKLGLNKKQIEIISKIAEPKRHYYVVTPEGNRLIELGLENNEGNKKSIILDYIGLSKEKGQQLIDCISNKKKAENNEN